jgi:hypothetical protein
VIPDFEQRLVVRYMVGDRVVEFAGWARSIAGRVGGRNRWFLCLERDVVDVAGG